MTFNDPPEKLFPFQDRIRLGDGVFDTLLVIIKEGGETLLPFAQDHFLRLLGSANIMRIPCDGLPDAQELEKKAITFVTNNIKNTGRFALNTLISRGLSKRGLMPDENAVPEIHMHISEVPTTFPPMHAIISKTVRRNEGSPLSRIKSCNYGDNILALIEARGKNANEAILLNNAGHVTCASAGNIFCCIDNKLITPPLSDGVMDGITRKIILERYAIERSITRKELENADGIYITNSIKGIKPVISLNGKTLPEPAIHINEDEYLEYL